MTRYISKDGIDKIVYTGTGVQEDILFKKDSGYSLDGSIRVTGGVSDVFTLQEKLVDWQDEIVSSGGKIPSLPITGKSAGVRLNIGTNISGNIILEIIL